MQALNQQPNIQQQFKTIMDVVARLTSGDKRERKIGKLGILKRSLERAIRKL
jgi:hypothetical protein